MFAQKKDLPVYDYAQLNKIRCSYKYRKWIIAKNKQLIGR